MKGLLSVSFGTSHADTRERTIDEVEKALRDAFPDRAFYSAWTSPRIIAKTRERGEWHDSLDEAFARLTDDGVTDLMVSTMCLMQGGEMAKTRQAVEAWAGQDGCNAHLAAPLLASTYDQRVMARIISDEFSFVGEADALLLMGHGSGEGDNDVYSAVQRELHMLGRPRFFVATVEGVPTFDNALLQLELYRPQRVYLAPLMMVAGDHAKNDLAGEGDDSWARQLEARGYQVETVLKGLGEYAGVQELVCEHVRDALTIREVALRG